METQASYFAEKRTLPNSTAILVLGILITIVPFMCCFIPGLTTCIIAPVMGFRGKAAYRNAPHEHTEASYKNFTCRVVRATMALSLPWLILPIHF